MDPACPVALVLRFGLLSLRVTSPFVPITQPLSRLLASERFATFLKPLPMA